MSHRQHKGSPAQGFIAHNLLFPSLLHQGVKQDPEDAMAAVSMLMAALIFSILQTTQTEKKIAACFGVSTLQLNLHLSISCLEHSLARNSTAMPGFPLFSYLYYSSRLGPLGL